MSRKCKIVFLCFECNCEKCNLPKPKYHYFWMCHRIINSATNECAGFPDSSVGKESACNGGDPGSIPESGRSPGEGIFYPLQYSWASLVAELVKNPPAMWETWVRSLGWEDPLEKGKAAHSSILAWRIPWTEEPVAYGVDIVRHDWTSTHAIDYGRNKKEASSLDSGENVNSGMGFGAGIIRFIPLEDRWAHGRSNKHWFVWFVTLSCRQRE